MAFPLYSPSSGPAPAPRPAQPLENLGEAGDFDPFDPRVARRDHFSSHKPDDSSFRARGPSLVTSVHHIARFWVLMRSIYQAGRASALLRSVGEASSLRTHRWPPLSLSPVLCTAFTAGYLDSRA